MIRDASSMDHPVDRQKASRRRRWIWIGGLAAVILIGLVAFPSVRRWTQSETSVQLSRIRLGEVTRGDLVRDVSVQGNVVAAYRPTLVSPARGTVRVETRDGQVVEAGQVLLRVESPELASRVEQERSALLSLKADYERQRILAKQAKIQSLEDLGLLKVELGAAERAMARAKKTREEGLLNQVEYEAAQDGLKVARMKLGLAEQRAQFELETLAFDVQDRASRAERQGLVLTDFERQVDDLAVRAPVAGMVSRVQVNEGDTVDRGDVLVTVVDLSEFEIEIAVPENYADELLPGTQAEVRYDNRDFPAAVKSISPVVEGSRVRGVITFTEEAPAGLKQNQRLSTRIVLETRPDVVKVARGPFLESGGGRQAYVIDNGTAVLRLIEVGSLSISEVEIVSGLEIGDTIIISDLARFRGAQRILLRD